MLQAQSAAQPARAMIQLASLFSRRYSMCTFFFYSYVCDDTCLLTETSAQFIVFYTVCHLFAKYRALKAADKLYFTSL